MLLLLKKQLLVCLHESEHGHQQYIEAQKGKAVKAHHGIILELLDFEFNEQEANVAKCIQEYETCHKHETHKQAVEYHSGVIRYILEHS